MSGRKSARNGEVTGVGGMAADARDRIAAAGSKAMPVIAAWRDQAGTKMAGAAGQARDSLSPRLHAAGDKANEGLHVASLKASAVGAKASAAANARRITALAALRGDIEPADLEWLAKHKEGRSKRKLGAMVAAAAAAVGAAVGGLLWWRRSHSPTWLAADDGEDDYAERRQDPAVGTDVDPDLDGAPESGADVHAFSERVTHRNGHTKRSWP